MANSQTKKAIGATSTAVLAANSKRVYLCLVNDSDEAIYVKFGLAAVLNEGHRLNAGGGSLVLTAGQGDSYPVFCKSVNAICTSGSKNLCVVEMEK